MYSVKYLIVIFSVILYVNAEQKKVRLDPAFAAQILPAALECISETGVSPDIVIKLQEKTATEDENVKKFLFCAFRKTGVANKKGHIRVEKALSLYPKNVPAKDEVKVVIEDCNKEDGDTPVETTYKIFKCVDEKAPIRVVLI